MEEGEEMVFVWSAKWRAQVDKVQFYCKNILMIELRHERMAVRLNVDMERNEVELGSWEESQAMVNRVKSEATVYVGSCSRVKK